ncbi:hypothetical protein C8039_04615 [Halogeometricum sp. wsp3]|nr:hypothetical protein C8039_04615 [Halogeometricum sp. wsp3]
MDPDTPRRRFDSPDPCYAVTWLVGGGGNRSARRRRPRTREVGVRCSCSRRCVADLSIGLVFVALDLVQSVVRIVLGGACAILADRTRRVGTRPSSTITSGPQRDVPICTPQR